MFDTIGDLPAHPLMVHVPVVLLPLATIGVIAMTVRPHLVRSFGWLVTALAGIGFVGTVLAASSGESLEDDYRESGMAISDTLRDHGEMGETVRLLALLFFVIVLGWMLFLRWRRKVGEEQATAKARKPRHIAAVLAALAIVSGSVATVTMTLTAHNGAKSVWEP
ncbi:MAG TPA: hypothetical protein DCR14_01245 [Acidimicrobiaceae bacterium]|nr:hypothetical protein [Acidimicrobiaceae bacterium]